MSKLSFRARALDATKPLPIYHADELPDLSEYNTINRTVPQMPTGMEKEEETERHLQEVILAQQTNSVKKKHVYIPTPDAAITVAHYEEIAKPVQRTVQYIRVPGLGLEEEVPDYDLDSEDDEWLSAQTNERPLSPTHFERMMDKLEKGSGNTVLSEREAQLLLRDDEDLVLAVYDYWLAKRLRLGRALIPTVKNISKDGTSSSGNPYLAFRKRMEKMQTRKNRKNDETAYMQMLKLKRDLEKALSLAEMVKERENKKHTLALNQMNIFKKRYKLEDWSGSIMASLRPVATRSATSRQASTVSDDYSRTVLIKMDSSDEYDVHHVGRHEVLVSSSSGLKKKRKKKYYYQDSVAETPVVAATPDKDTSRELLSEKLEDDEPDGIFTFKRKPHVKYHHCRYPLGLWPWQVDEAGVSPSPLIGEDELQSLSWSQSKRYRFSRVSFRGQQQVNGLARRRVGRGGRVVWDRVHCPNDSEPDQTGTVDDPAVNDSTTTNNLDQQQAGSGAAPTSLAEGEAQASTTPSQAQQPQLEQKVPPAGLSDKKEESADTAPHRQVHRLHFEARSPSPSSNFDYQTLPYIEHPDHTLPVAAMGSMGHAPGNYQPISASELRLGRLPSSSEYREEALSFSTLPTSQFVLKPSSYSAMDLGDQQHSLLTHNRSCVDAMLEPYSWSWVRNAHLNPLHLRRAATTDHGSSGSGGPGVIGSSGGTSTGVGGNYHPHPSSSSSSVPTNYHHQIGGSGIGGGGSSGSSSPHYHHHQHAQGGLPSANEPRDISRSSLSVTSSKTIILSNAPVSHAPPTATPTPSTASGGSSTSATASTTSVSKTTPVVVPSKVAAGSQAQLQAQQLAMARRAGLSKLSSNSALSAQQRQDGTSQQPRGQPSTTTTTKISTKKEESKAKQQDGSGNSKAGEKRLATPPSQKSLAAAPKRRSPSSGGGQSSTTESAVLSPPRTTSGSDAAPVKAGEPKSATTADGAMEPMDTSSSSSSGAPRKTSESSTTDSQLNTEKLKPSESKSSSVKKVVEDGESSKALSAWMVGKPAASILQLSRPRKREREGEKNDNDNDDDSNPPKTKVRRTLVASAEAALLISTQFAQQIVKKEETAQPLTVTHALNSAVMGIAGARNVAAAAAGLSTAGLPMSTADAISHNITKIPLNLTAATASNLPAVQNAAKLLALDTIQPLQQNQQIQQQQQHTAVLPAVVSAPAPVVNSVPDGIGGHLAGALIGAGGGGQDKKAAATVVNAVSASGQAQALPPPTVATNLAVRRSSAGTNGTNNYQEIFHTERMKQALAGMNHNSLIESAKNSFVPMNKPSEVT